MSARPIDDAVMPSATNTTALRQVHHADAMVWLSSYASVAGTSVVTSLPDVSEVGMPLDQWETFFVDAAALCMQAAGPNDVSVFFQTDIKKGHVWVDKSELLHRAARRVGVALLFRKVVCRKPPGTLSPGRPAFTHLLCFSRDARPIEPHGIPDVIADAGEQLWVRAMGVAACAQLLTFVKQRIHSTTILDPFCGVGTVLAVANQLGMGAIGVEKNRKRAVLSMSASIDPM